MQSAETVVDILRARGRRGLPCDELYRQLFNPALFLMAWGRIYANDGAMTPGACGETADGMSLAKIGRIIDALRHERYRFQPVRRVYIPKKSGSKMRPLGLPSWSDKLVGEVVRILLEAYYEPRFSGRSHGFRPGRGCHTALAEIARTCSGPDTWKTGSGTRRFPVRRKAAWHPLSCLTFAWTGWISSPRQSSSRNIPEGKAGKPILPGPRWRTRWRPPGGAATVLRYGNCASSGGACPPGIPVIPVTAGSGTSATPTITCSGSPARRPKPSRSNSAWPTSCVMISSWNCRQARR